MPEPMYVQYVKDFGLLGVVAYVIYALINFILPQMRALQEQQSSMQEQESSMREEHAKQNSLLDEICRRFSVNGYKKE